MRKVLSVIAVMCTLTTLSAKERCRVSVSISDDADPVELIICPKAGDPDKTAVFRAKSPSGRLDYDLEVNEAKLYEIVDWGQVMKENHTSRLATFYAEDGAVIDITLDGDRFSVESTGQLHKEARDFEKAAEDKFKPLFEAIEADGASEQEIAALNERYDNWCLEYYKEHPGLSFMLDVDYRLASFRSNDRILAGMLDIYHDKCMALYPGHSVHESIAANESKRYQICGRKYQDYGVYTLDGEIDSAYRYYKDKPTLVILWATWCLPCRRDACEAIDVVKPYMARGLNVFSVAREFGNLDNLNAAVGQDKYPWPCLADLDNGFGVFERHGVTIGGMFLIDRDGRIVRTLGSVDELIIALSELDL